MTTFAEGKERNTALGAWGGIGAFGAVAGVLLGGVLSDLLSWEWIFFINVPVGLVALALTPLLLEESRDLRVKSFDAPGAVLVTAGLVALVFGITQASDYGWGSGATIGIFLASAALLVGFLVWEMRAAEPLMPLWIFRIRTVAGANVAGLTLGTAVFAMFLMLTLYMQQVLAYSPMKTGVAYLAVAGTAIIWSFVASTLVTRVGVKPVLVAGMAMLTAGLVYFTQVSVDGSYAADLLPGFLLIAVGLGFSFVSISIAALAGVRHSEAGLASGLHQHLAAGRRRARRRRARDGGHLANRRRDSRRLCASRRADQRLRGGLHRRGGDRLRRRAGRTVRGPARGSRSASRGGTGARARARAGRSRLTFTPAPNP